jgi:hypothetical protein
MQKIIIFFLLCVIGCSDVTYVAPEPATHPRSVDLYAVNDYYPIQYDGTSFIRGINTTPTYTLDNPIVEFNIPDGNINKFYEYVAGYNSAVTIAYSDYNSFIDATLLSLNRVKNTESPELLLQLENQKISASNELQNYIATFQRCQYGFITKVLTLIPNRYYKDKFIYGLQQSSWFIGYI